MLLGQILFNSIMVFWNFVMQMSEKSGKRQETGEKAGNLLLQSYEKVQVPH